MQGKIDWNRLALTALAQYNFAFLASQPNEHDYLLETVPYVIERLCSKYLQSEGFLFES